MIRKLVFLAALAIPAVPCLAIADDHPAKMNPKMDPSTGKLADGDAEEIYHLHALHGMEIDMGKLAVKNGGSDVRKYGAQLVKEHTAADKDLVKLAKKKGITTIKPEAPTAEHNANMAEMDKLKGLKGTEFDKEYLAAMIDGHTKEVGKAGAATTTVQDKDLIAYIGTIKPVMQKHADDAQTLQRGVK